MPETTTDPTPRKKAGAPLNNAPGPVPYHVRPRPSTGEFRRQVG